MTQQHTTTTELVGDRELIMTRRFDAPRHLVWQAWTQQEQLEAWWGPEGFTTTTRTLDLRPGGIWHYFMHSSDYGGGWAKVTFREIVEPERLVFDDVFSDEEGNVADSMPKSVITVTFTEEAGQTVLRMHALYPTPEDRNKIVEMGFEQGMTSSLDRLTRLLAAK